MQYFPPQILFFFSHIYCSKTSKLLVFLCTGPDVILQFGASYLGELPLIHKVRQHLQKIVRELTENIDLDSGLLESLQALDVISEIDYQDIKAEKKPSARAKSLWDILLRGSDSSFEKFKVEIVKTQPEMIKLIGKLAIVFTTQVDAHTISNFLQLYLHVICWGCINIALEADILLITA